MTNTPAVESTASNRPATEAARAIFDDPLIHFEDCVAIEWPDDGDDPRWSGLDCNCVCSRLAAIEAEARADTPAAALDAIFAEHRKCGPKYEGCYSHFDWMEHCRADGMAWPCDVDTIRARLTEGADR